MKISVVTACFNSAKTIRHTLDSFAAQTHADKEMLIVDGLSRDGTLDIVRSYNLPGIRIISERDKGIYDAMNKGLRNFGGDAVGTLNSDDTFHDRFALERVAEALNDADIAYGDLAMVSDHVSKRPVRIWQAGAYTSSAFRLGWVPPHPTFYVRRGVIDAVGEFDLTFKIASDYDFMLRAMMLHQFRIRYIDKILVDYQMGGNSSNGLRNIVLGNLECLTSRRRNLGSLPVDLAFVVRPFRRLSQWRAAKALSQD